MASVPPCVVFICNKAVGFVVPMPIFPLPVIRIASIFALLEFPDEPAGEVLKSIDPPAAFPVLICGDIVKSAPAVLVLEA